MNQECYLLSWHNAFTMIFVGFCWSSNIIYPTYRRGTIFASSYRFHPDDDDGCVLNTVDYQKFQWSYWQATRPASFTVDSVCRIIIHEWIPATKTNWSGFLRPSLLSRESSSTLSRVSSSTFNELVHNLLSLCSMEVWMEMQMKDITVGERDLNLKYYLVT